MKHPNDCCLFHMEYLQVVRNVKYHSSNIIEHLYLSKSPPKSQKNMVDLFLYCVDSFTKAGYPLNTMSRNMLRNGKGSLFLWSQGNTFLCAREKWKYYHRNWLEKIANLL